MTSSKFWDETTISVILSFPQTPAARLSFISLTYDLGSSSTTALLGMGTQQSHGKNYRLTEYNDRLDAANKFWAHPLVLVIVMLDAQLTELDRGVANNNLEVTAVESSVASVSGRDDISMPQLMNNAHTALKGSIKLLDAIHWLSRSLSVLTEVGDELNTHLSRSQPFSSSSNKNVNKHTSLVIRDWVQMKQYLQDMSRLCDSLEADPVMSEKRCQAQIDILYSKMAQEDNMLNFSIAVASTRDSSAMKALAVITALFLPASYIATLFSMSMFNWQASSSSSSSSSGDGVPQNESMVMPMIWLYWVIAVVLTFIVIFAWRWWWVSQDRSFSKRLPQELNETPLFDNKHVREDLQTGFWQDFFPSIGRRR
ncbi:hypothetical protein EJ08DRAFT_23525 [Tothia fuscella]|uniref:Uncharacterized protein n=1 Tax=Tothia fuscella TaxID=1048955 RepID=A0A9P4NZQ8_9PEZI|nr:hypothetical protein EJ08DRAFT_23525 [Tothia fuscella]